MVQDIVEVLMVIMNSAGRYQQHPYNHHCLDDSKVEGKSKDFVIAVHTGQVCPHRLNSLYSYRRNLVVHVHSIVGTKYVLKQHQHFHELDLFQFLQVPQQKPHLYQSSSSQ